MMVYGRTPFQHITNHLQKLQCIMDPSHVIEFPDINDKHLLDVIEVCLLFVFCLFTVYFFLYLFIHILIYFYFLVTCNNTEN